jgi:hypothetical protein
LGEWEPTAEANKGGVRTKLPRFTRRGWVCVGLRRR